MDKLVLTALWESFSFIQPCSIKFIRSVG